MMVARTMQRFLRSSLKYCLITATLISVAWVISPIYTLQIDSKIKRNTESRRLEMEDSSISCENGPGCPTDSFSANQWIRKKLTRADVLMIAETTASPIISDVAVILEHLRIRYVVHLVYSSLRGLYLRDRPRFATIIFQNLSIYKKLKEEDRLLLIDYCKFYGIGMVVFVASADSMGDNSFSLKSFDLLNVSNYEVNQDTPILRILKPAETVQSLPSVTSWVHFQITDSYSPIAYAQGIGKGSKIGRYPVAIYGKDKTDGIERVFLNNGFHFFVENLLFMDAIFHISGKILNIPLDRYIMVDVDDTLRATESKIPTLADVREMVNTTKRLRAYVEGFHFNLGIIGRGQDIASGVLRESNDYVMENKDFFFWFDHTYSHPNIITLNDSWSLKENYKYNQNFIKENKLPTKQYSYQVTPFHAGIYPIYKPAYRIWRSNDISVTSTLNYYYKPALRFLAEQVGRGFIYNGVRVLPRKSYGIYTDSINLTSSQVEKLSGEVQGGRTFLHLAYDLVNIYMTHYCNYAYDRMAIVILEKLIRFANKWTNLEMKTVRPTEMADRFFDLYPEERSPFWTLPCNYRHQKKYWLRRDACSGRRYPDAFVVGPAQTGTKLFYHLLSSIRKANFYKEIRNDTKFFTDNYLNGIDWYTDQFSNRPQNLQSLYVEVDSNIFLGEKSAKRLFTFLPYTKIISIVPPPEYIVLECVQGYLEKTSISANVEDILFGPGKQYEDIQDTCLEKGNYFSIFSRWLEFFSPKQILLVDYEELCTNPVGTLDEVMHFLNIEEQVEGFALIHQEHVVYANLSERLAEFHEESNRRLAYLFESVGMHLPKWLRKRTR